MVRVGRGIGEVGPWLVSLRGGGHSRYEMYFVLLMIDVMRDKRDWILYLNKVQYKLV